MLGPQKQERVFKITASQVEAVISTYKSEKLNLPYWFVVNAERELLALPEITPVSIRECTELNKPERTSYARENGKSRGEV